MSKRETRMFKNETYPTFRYTLVETKEENGTLSEREVSHHRLLKDYVKAKKDYERTQ